MPTDSPHLAIVKRRVQDALERLEPLFVDGARLTFIMRLPDNPDATLVVTSDDAKLAAAALLMEATRDR